MSQCLVQFMLDSCFDVVFILVETNFYSFFGHRFFLRSMLLAGKNYICLV